MLNFLQVPRDVSLVPMSSGNELWELAVAVWAVRNEETSLEVMGDNLQKKMIPVKCLMPDYEEMLADCATAGVYSRRKISNTGTTQ